MDGRNNFPKLHNAMWPGLVGKGPDGALDAKMRESMRTELKRLHLENPSTTIYETHDQVEANRR